jgi:hypothetical protein
VSAFSKAILDQVSDLTREVQYELICNDTVTVCLARDYMNLRHEEEKMIALCLANKISPSILDLGACIGRHSKYAQIICPKANITLVERDPLLRQHCLNTVNPKAAFSDYSDIGNNFNFDVVFMLGLGLGIFGSEDKTRKYLKDVLNRLKPGGSLLIEGGKSTPGEFTTQSFSIRYGQEQDVPFDWGYATFNWLEDTLEGIENFDVTHSCGTSNGDNYFICKVNKRD